MLKVYFEQQCNLQDRYRIKYSNTEVDNSRYVFQLWKLKFFPSLPPPPHFFELESLFRPELDFTFLSSLFFSKHTQVSLQQSHEEFIPDCERHKGIFANGGIGSHHQNVLRSTTAKPCCRSSFHKVEVKKVISSIRITHFKDNKVFFTFFRKP